MMQNITVHLSEEIAVINDDLIRSAVCSKENADPANRSAFITNEFIGQHRKAISNSESNPALCDLSAKSNDNNGVDIDFSLVCSLKLSFKNIFKIANLVTLDNLTTLKLDNNVIDEIEGIDHLVKLEWLDLSFNNISVIQGLDKLVLLTDLTLYNNNISKLENLENLSNLQVFSIGNNSLNNTEGLLYLRCLESLKVLNLYGNPVCSDPEYRLFVLAHLDKLKYLDYALVDSSEVQQAREQYQDELEEWKEIKAIEDAALAREIGLKEYNEKLRDANVILLETLFSDMMNEDTEINKIQPLPGLQNLIDDYCDKVKAITEEVKTTLLEKHSLMMLENQTFRQLYEEAQQKAQLESIKASETYKRKAKKYFKKAAVAAESEIAGIFSEAQSTNEKMYGELMNSESDLVEKSQELVLNLESKIEVIGSEARDIATEHFRSVEQMENNFFEAISQLAAHLLERLATEDAEDEDLLSDECRAILNDRDALNNAINGSHDVHIGKLLAQEDIMRERNTSYINEKIATAKEEEWRRNRKRVAEIINIKKKNLAEIDDLREELNRVEDDFY